MLVDSDTLIPITLANQNFSQVARLVEQHGRVIVMKNNVPSYVIQSFKEIDDQDKLDQEINRASDALMARNDFVYDQLSR